MLQPTAGRFRILYLVLGVALFASSAVAQKKLAMTFDDELARVADRAPAFGGFFFDSATGKLKVYSWNQTASGKAQAIDALRAVFGDRLPAAAIEVIAGNYGFGELKPWGDRLLELLSMPGVVLTDIDDARNRLRVGVERQATAGRVRDRLAVLGIPGEAVDVVEMRPVRPLITNLRAKIRPLVGGIQIVFSTGGSTFACTLGFNAVRAGVAGEVINSHCSGIQGGNQGTIEFQPASPSRIGIETLDPTYFTGSPCPAGKKCRRSDSAFVRRDAGITATQGRLARTALGTIAWSGTDFFRIVKEADPIVGQSATKVGRTTGRSVGQVEFACANIGITGSNIVQLCQAYGSINSAGGDSGSPVFKILNSPAANDVALNGILWGGDGAGHSAFSMISQIQRSTAPAELGPLTTCASGFTC
jgi:hypothetical protein